MELVKGRWVLTNISNWKANTVKVYWSKVIFICFVKKKMLLNRYEMLTRPNGMAWFLDL